MINYINIQLYNCFDYGDGDWGLGIGIGDWAQSPIPNPQSPIPNDLHTLKSLLIK